MAYKKPEIVAKSDAKESFVAGCPANKGGYTVCSTHNRNCQMSPAR